MVGMFNKPATSGGLFNNVSGVVDPMLEYTSKFNSMSARLAAARSEDLSQALGFTADVTSPSASPTPAVNVNSPRPGN